MCHGGEGSGSRKLQSPHLQAGEPCSSKFLGQGEHGSGEPEG